MLRAVVRCPACVIPLARLVDTDETDGRIIISQTRVLLRRVLNRRCIPLSFQPHNFCVLMRQECFSCLPCFVAWDCCRNSVLGRRTGHKFPLLSFTQYEKEAVLDQLYQ